MKLTFPHMGNMYIPVKVLLDTIGLQYIIPPLCNKNTLESGSVHSPEFMCLPFKTMLGDFLYALNKGADVILCGASCGQCRQGYYGELHNEILKDMGYKYEYIDINLSNMSFEDFYKKFSPFIKDVKKSTLIKGLIFAAKILFSSEKLFNLANYTRCREIEKGEVDLILKQFYDELPKTNDYNEVSKLISSSVKNIKAIDKDPHKKLLKIAIIGEIFTICEPFTNLDIEKRLGYLGVEVVNTMSVGLWVKEHGLRNILPLKSKNSPHMIAQDFIHTADIGGHGIDTVGNAIFYSKKKIRRNNPHLSVYMYA